MASWEVWLIILLVVGVIASNLAVLRYNAKFKLPQFGHKAKPYDAHETDREAKPDGLAPDNNAEAGNKPATDESNDAQDGTRH